ncbi:MAG: hypothetical protein D6710_04615 [Nitrospirae bacterium]|nr:MAG: hypothetical protein D6710_04615 [Nitrospirota bacterium]
MFSRPRVIMVAVFIATLLSLIFFYQNVIKYKPVQIPPEGEKKEKMVTVESKTKVVEIKESLLQKNLFNPERTYVEKTEEEVVQEEPEPPKQMPSVELKGIILNQYDEYIAVLSINNQKPVMLRTGDKIEDIEVVEISDRTVELQWFDEPILLTMDKIKTLEKKR